MIKHFTTLSGDKYFTVAGAGKFPLHMLRHDRCFPCTENDVEAILAEGQRRRIRLCSRAKLTPNVALWLRHDWHVEPIKETVPA